MRQKTWWSLSENFDIIFFSEFSWGLVSCYKRFLAFEYDSGYFVFNLIFIPHYKKIIYLMLPLSLGRTVECGVLFFRLVSLAIS